MKKWPACLAVVFVLWFGSVTNARTESYTFTTIAGQVGIAAGTGGSADGTNSGALFFGSAGIATDGGKIYVADGDAIRTIMLSGTNWEVITLAGLGWMHGAADGTNTNARLNYPQSVAVDIDTNIFVADTYNHTIRKVTPIGTNWVVSTLAGSNTFAGSLDGTNSEARFDHPYGIAVDILGTLYVADSGNNRIRSIRQIGSDWVVTTLAGSVNSLSGSADGTNGTARFDGPAGIAEDGGGNLFVADFNNNTIRQITPIGTNWVVSTPAGFAGESGSANGTNNAARFYQPQGVAFDANGNLFVTDGGNNTIRKIKPVGTNWVVSTVAGLPGNPGSANGTGNAARFSSPYGIAVDSAGTVFVADSYNFTMRLGRLAMLLAVNVSSNRMTLTWPLAGSNFVLETRNTLAPNPSWTRLSNGIVVSGDSYVLNTNIVAPAAFYRLHKP